MGVTVVGADAFLLPFRGGRVRLRRTHWRKSVPTRQQTYYQCFCPYRAQGCVVTTLPRVPPLRYRSEALPWAEGRLRFQRAWRSLVNPSVLFLIRFEVSNAFFIVFARWAGDAGTAEVDGGNGCVSLLTGRRWRQTPKTFGESQPDRRGLFLFFGLSPALP